MRLLGTGSLNGHPRGAHCYAVRERPLRGVARRQVCAARASRPAAEPGEHKAQPHGFGGTALQSGGSQASVSRPTALDSGTAASDAASEARTEAVEARLLRRLDAGGSGDGVVGGRTDAIRSATTSGREAAAAGAGARGSGRALKGAPARGKASAPSAGGARGPVVKVAADTAAAGVGGAVVGRGARGVGVAAGVGPAKAGRNASAKSGAPREAHAPAPARSAAPGERSKRQQKRATGETTERLAKVSAFFLGFGAQAEAMAQVLWGVIHPTPLCAGTGAGRRCISTSCRGDHCERQGSCEWGSGAGAAAPGHPQRGQRARRQPCGYKLTACGSSSSHAF